MKVLIVHNQYQQLGGEDSVVSAESQLLADKGNEVRSYCRNNDEIRDANKMQVALHTFWSGRTTSDINQLIKVWKPDVIHSHNTFPLISPSLYWAARKRGVPVVQTLHNFRLLCPQAMLLRNGMVCEDCVGRTPVLGVIRRCYRDSYAQSAILGGMLSTHRLIGSYSKKVTRYIALNRFCQNKFIDGGIPEHKIAVKPNFVDVPETPTYTGRSGAIYVGRLSREKGVSVLAHALSGANDVALNVVGTGSEDQILQCCKNAHLHGWMEKQDVLSLMGRASYLVMPSIWYENFPMTILEAFSSGLPVIASRIGALAEIVEDGVTGLLFEAGSGDALRAKMQWAQKHPLEMLDMGKNARRRYEELYSPDRNYQMLMHIYENVIEEQKK